MSSRRKPQTPPPAAVRPRWPLRLVVLGAAIALAAVAWLGIGRWVQSSLVSYLPEPPDLTGVPAARAETLSAADAAARAHPESAERVGYLGKVYFANLEYDRAGACYQRAAALSAGDWRWRYYHVLLMEELGEVRPTAEMLRQIVEINESHALAWYRLAQADFKLGNDEAARAACEKAAALRRSSAKTSAAEEGFPVSAHTQLLLARIALRRSEPQRALKILQSLLGDYPEFGPARRQLAQTYQALDRAGDAARETKRAAFLASYTPPVDPVFEELVDLSRSSTFLLRQVGVAKRAGRTARAGELIRRAHQYEPDDMDALGILAQTLMAEGRPEQALPHFQQMVERHPDKGKALGVLAGCLAVLGKRPEALKHYRRALELKPDDVQTGNNLAAMLMEDSQWVEAESVLRKLLDADPGCAEVAGNLGRLLALTQRKEQGLPLLRKAVEIRPENAFMRQDLAGVLVMCGRPDDAIAEYREALEYSPYHAASLSNLLKLLLQRGSLPEAFEIADRLVQVVPKAPVAQYHYALAAAKLARKDLALLHCRRALELEPKLAPAQQLLTELQK